MKLLILFSVQQHFGLGCIAGAWLSTVEQHKNSEMFMADCRWWWCCGAAQFRMVHGWLSICCGAAQFEKKVHWLVVDGGGAAEQHSSEWFMAGCRSAAEQHSLKRRFIGWLSMVVVEQHSSDVERAEFVCLF